MLPSTMISRIAAYVVCTSPILVLAAPVTVQTLNYTAVAEATEDVRLFIMGNKADGQTDEDFKYQFEVVHSVDTERTAKQSPGTLLQYYQGLHLRETVKIPELAAWNDSYAPFTSWTPSPTIYQPVSLARHHWTSIENLNKTQHSPQYTNSTGQHVFGKLEGYLALLTPLAKLSWNQKTYAFEDESKPNPDAQIHVSLFIGDSSEGASHETIYRTLQVRRAYIESVLRESPSLASGLTNFVQSGKSLQIGNDPKSIFGPIFENSVFEAMTVWQHVAVEEFYFRDAASAATFMKSLPWLKHLLWDGSSGSFSFVTKIALIFDWVDQL